MEPGIKFSFLKDLRGSADRRQQPPGRSGLQVCVRRVQLVDAFMQHQGPLARSCVCSTERNIQLLGQPFLLREVVLVEKAIPHVKAPGQALFSFLSVPHFLESISCSGAHTVIRGFLALSK